MRASGIPYLLTILFIPRWMLQCGSGHGGGVLKLHPKIVVGNGAMNAFKKYRGKIASVIMSYVKNMENDLKNARPERVFITHSGCDRETVEAVWFPAIAVWVRLAFCILRYDFSNTL